MKLIEELRRRNVFRVSIGYVVSCWLLVQIADLMLDPAGAPDWVLRTVLLLMLLGFPVVVFFSWAYEVTPDGIKKESEVDRSRSITHVTGRKLDRAITLVLAAAVIFLLADKFFLNARHTEPDMPRQTASEGSRSVAVLPFVAMSRGEDTAEGCSAGNWINQFGDPYGRAEATQRWLERNLRCDPLSGIGILSLVQALNWGGDPEAAMRVLDEAETKGLTVPFEQDVRLATLLAGGPFMLVETTQMCMCGAPFDLDATPNFQARIREAGFDWPPPKPIDYPMKDW